MATVLPTRAQTNSTSSSSGASTHPSSQPSFSSFPSRNRSTSQSSKQSLARQHNRNVSSSQHPAQTTTNNGATHSRFPKEPLPKPTYKPVKSQYPRGSTEKHVEYILVASFDIDRGSIMEHQYPAPVGGDEHMLAELMLPDQAHVRSQDWTVFFLHKDVSVDDDEDEDEVGDSASLRRRKRRRRRRRALEEGDQTVGGSAEGEDQDSTGDHSDEGSDSDLEEQDTDGPPLVYVLNLVNTKHESSVKRGAIVKAMAICTRHSFLHIYKPLLLLALEQYFSQPVPETLAALYDAVNGMDLSLMPHLNLFERFILQSSDAKDMFVEKFEAIIAQRMAEKERQESLASVDTTTDPVSPTSGPCSRYGLPRDTHEFESVIRYTNVPVPVKIPTALAAETVGDFSLIKLIQTFSTPHSTSPVPFSPTHPHLTTNGPGTHPIIVLLNALLTQKRVIFLGHNLPSSSVAEAVLAACSLASGGFLRGFTRHAFPYTDLTKIDDLLKVPGFIAGVTNPAFGHHAEWWDVLCDLSAGRIKISAKIEMPPLTEGVVFFQNNNGGVPSSASTATSHAASGHMANSAFLTGNTSGDATGDQAFMAHVLSAISERQGENAIRSKFRLWVLKFTRLAASFEEAVYGASALHIQPAPSPPSLHPETATNSPISPSTPGTAADAAYPPETTGHGYIWPSASAKTHELAANATRVEGWRNTRSYYNFIQDLAAHFPHQPVKDLDLQHLHDKLAKLRLPASSPAAGADSSAEGLYLTICTTIQTPAEITQLLSVIINSTSLPSALLSQGSQPGGLFYLALGLLHPKREVREAVAALLGRVREHEAGRHFWTGLGRFMRGVWERVVAGMEEWDEEEGR
ncbi:hypothetical protein MBLNU230_g2463t1 [Neophaeotheca triangularis]